MRLCPRPLSEQTLPELFDCGVRAAEGLVARLFQAYGQVIAQPGEAGLADWGIVLFTFCTGVIAISKALYRGER